VDPAFARKLLHDLAGWSRSIGIAPHQDYAEAEALFGDVSTAACSEVFEFGMDGRPLFVPGPEDTPAQIRRWIGQLRRTLGTTVSMSTTTRQMMTQSNHSMMRSSKRGRASTIRTGTPIQKNGWPWMKMNG
jgi:hypothetical protein